MNRGVPGNGHMPAGYGIMSPGRNARPLASLA
jgi:hypothetical protein